MLLRSLYCFFGDGSLLLLLVGQRTVSSAPTAASRASRPLLARPHSPLRVLHLERVRVWCDQHQDQPQARHRGHRRRGRQAACLAVQATTSPPRARAAARARSARAARPAERCLPAAAALSALCLCALSNSPMRSRASAAARLLDQVRCCGLRCGPGAGLALVLDICLRPTLPGSSAVVARRQSASVECAAAVIGRQDKSAVVQRRQAASVECAAAVIGRQDKSSDICLSPTLPGSCALVTLTNRLNRVRGVSSHEATLALCHSRRACCSCPTQRPGLEEVANTLRADGVVRVQQQEPPCGSAKRICPSPVKQLASVNVTQIPATPPAPGSFVYRTTVRFSDEDVTLSGGQATGRRELAGRGGERGAARASRLRGALWPTRAN
jgi:hypothetical protein